MTERFGDRATFAVELGGVATPGLRTVDLWLAGKRLTVTDNAAYVPSFAWYMRLDVDRVRRREIPARPFLDHDPEGNFRLLQADRSGFRQRFWFLQWTEILDNVESYAFQDTDLVIVFTFRRDDHPTLQEHGTVFTLRIPPDDFVAVAEAALAALA